MDSKARALLFESAYQTDLAIAPLEGEEAEWVRLVADFLELHFSLERSFHDGEERVANTPAVRIKHVPDKLSSEYYFNIEELRAKRVAAVTEIALGKKSGSFLARTSVAHTASGTVSSCLQSLLCHLADHSRLTDAGRTLAMRGFCVDSAEKLSEVSNLISSPDRRLPVIVVADGNTNWSDLDSRTFAAEVFGIAHVVHLKSAEVDRFNRVFGGCGLVVPAGGIRIFFPGCVENPDPWFNRLTLSESIDSWNGNGKAGSIGFSRWLAVAVQTFSVSSAEKVNYFDDFVQRVLASASEGESPQRQSSGYDASIASDEQLSQWVELASGLDEELREVKDQLRDSRSANSILIEKVREFSRLSGVAAFPAPDRYADFPEWIEVVFPDRLILLPRARRSLQASNFQKVHLVVSSIELLGKEYWELMSNNEPERSRCVQKQWLAGLERLSLSYSPKPMSEARLGEVSGQYTVAYQIGNTMKQTLGPHLKFGTRHDERYCMRIYFFWDPERQKVVIGHLTSHLDTRLS